MNIVYSDTAKQSREFPLLQQASQRLADIIGPDARFVTTEWDRSVGADGQPLYMLKLKDPRGEASTTFDLWQLQRPVDVRLRLRSRGTTCCVLKLIGCSENAKTQSLENEMPRDSDGKKIDELDKLTANMVARLERATDDIKNLAAALSTTARELSDVRREHEKEIALLKKEGDDLKKGQERWGQRLWMILAPLIAGAAGIFLAHYLKIDK